MIPFCPFPISKAKKISKKFLGLAESLVKFSPSLDLELKQANLPLDKREYMSIVLFSALFIFSITFVVFFSITSLLFPVVKSFPVSIGISAFLFFMVFFYLRMYPKLLVKKKIANIEKNLLYALRHLYIQVKSGVTIYDSIVSVSNGNYGQVSSEFKKIAKEVSSGASMESSLERTALENPSLHFRRAIWQLSNGIRAGSDVGNVLRSILDNISDEQRIAIRRYGSQLNPLTLVYMMFAVILPSLGITFLIVISSLSGFSVNEKIFLGILGILAVFQFMFLGVMKSRRPSI